MRYIYMYLLVFGTVTFSQISHMRKNILINVDWQHIFSFSFFQGVLCICTVRRQQSNIFYDSWSKCTIQLVNHFKMKDALKFPVGSSVKCLQVIYANLHFLPTKILPLLTYQNSYSFSWERIPFSCQSIANLVCLVKCVANQDCIHSATREQL